MIKLKLYKEGDVACDRLTVETQDGAIVSGIVRCPWLPDDDNEICIHDTKCPMAGRE
jgi:hypothetical protein